MLHFTACLVVVALHAVPAACDPIYHDYCVVGAGPGGLQMGYFLHSAGRDYVVFERSNQPGSFFQLYPRHRNLISINKRNTGQTNVQFNLRHDWNSLLSHDDDLLVTKYSKIMFPRAEVLLDYFKDFQQKLNIRVLFNTNIENIHQVTNRSAPDGHVFRMNDQRQQIYTCRTLIVASGVSTPNIPKMKGIELAKGYEDMSIDPHDYEGKSVLILGKGNSAFEVAAGLYGVTNFIHLTSRSRVRHAWATHYVGDLRAVNNEVLDTYQLKTLDGLLEFETDSTVVLSPKGGKIYLLSDLEAVSTFQVEDSAVRDPYDVVIRALGFTFDDTLFNNTEVTRGEGKASKYPAIDYNYESVDVDGLFYAGTASHSLDFRKSAGGFIHGFRYTARALHRLMEWRYEGIPWPSKTIPRSQLLGAFLKRINEASGIYQMFQSLGDIAILSEDGKTATYIEEFPIHLIHKLAHYTGIQASSVLVVVLEYGKSFSHPASDVFRQDRATGDPAEAHTSNFLHPVFYFYKSLPTEMAMLSKGKRETLPRPDKLHHMVEDFLTRWDQTFRHIIPFRRFLEEVLRTDLRVFFPQTCFQYVMTRDSLPEYCDQGYLSGRGLHGTERRFHKSPN